MINKILTVIEDKYCAPKKRIICLDFDGVIHSYNSGWCGARNIPDDPVEGALEWIVGMVALHSKHYQIAVYSARSRYIGGRKAIKKWINKHLYKKYGDFVLPLEHYDEFIWHLKFPIKKPPAYITVDDRCICFDGKYDNLFSEIANFKTYYSSTSV